MSKHHQNPSFHRVNEPFVCENCGANVPPARRSCRNHCPKCLTSKHLDHSPGDRQNECGALMDAVSYERSGKKGLVLIFRCRGCGGMTKNVTTSEDDPMPDDYERILKLGPTYPPS